MRLINSLELPPSNAEVAAAILVGLQRTAEPDACVATAINIKSISPATADAVATALLGKGQIRNMWFALGEPQGCPKPVLTRYSVVRASDRTVVARFINTGEAISSLSQQRDAMVSVTKRVGQTRFDGPSLLFRTKKLSDWPDTDCCTQRRPW